MPEVTIHRPGLVERMFLEDAHDPETSIPEAIDETERNLAFISSF